jgi:hypothetical protein
MSEYQYYEFRAIDNPLAEDQKDDVSALSSRGYVTAYTASFVYNYGDFRGEVDTLMSDYFDAGLYMTNWGTRWLIFRIFSSWVDIETIKCYSLHRAINIKLSKDQKYVIIDLKIHDDEGGGWTDGEGWLDALIGIRNEFINGDFRALYLAWLKAAELAFNYGTIDKDTIEPPIPARLKDLSTEQEAYLNFLDMNKALVEAAAVKSKIRNSKPVNLEKWIAKLPAQEQHDILVRLSRGEGGLSIHMNKRLGQLSEEFQPTKKEDETKCRTIAQLMEATEKLHQRKVEEKRHQEELAHQKKMKALSSKKENIWKKVIELINKKKLKSYDEAIVLLKELKDLAIYQENIKEFHNRIEIIQKTYPKLPGLLRRIEEAKLKG